MGTKIIVNGEIVDPKRKGKTIADKYIKGAAKGLLRLEITITIPELRRMISAFPHEYSNIEKKFKVPITLVIGPNAYNGKLGFPKSRLEELHSGKYQNNPWHEPWISASLYDKNGDVKLAYALYKGRFKTVGPVKLEVLRERIRVLKP